MTPIYNSKEVKNDFMEKSNSNDLAYDKEQIIGENFQNDGKFIGEQLESCEKLLESSITEEVQGPVLVKKMISPTGESNKK